MKNLLGYCLLFIFLGKVQSRPQITKLFPIHELAAFHHETNEIKPLDKLLGKLRATYNFVFNKPEDTSNVGKILAKDARNPDVEALKLLWTNLRNTRPNPTNDGQDLDVAERRTFDTNNGSKNTIPFDEKTTLKEDEVTEKTTSLSKDDWLDGIEAPDPLDNLELQDNPDDDMEIATPASTLHLPIAVGRQLLDWLGALLGLTYGAYNKVAMAIKA